MVIRIENENVNLKEKYLGTDGQIWILPTEGPGRYRVVDGNIENFRVNHRKREYSIDYRGKNKISCHTR